MSGADGASDGNSGGDVLVATDRPFDEAAATGPETVEASMFEDVGEEAILGSPEASHAPVDAAMDVANTVWTHCQINAQCPSGQVCFVENGFACGDALGDGVCVTRLADTCTGYGCPCLKLIPPYYCGQAQGVGCWGGDLRGEVTGTSAADTSQCWICHEPQ
jgi:hypothetical protein